MPGDLAGKNKAYLEVLINVISLTVMILGINSSRVRAEKVNDLNPLFQTLTAARFVEVQNWERIKEPDLPLSRVKEIFKGESKQGKWLGTVLHLVTPGYDGPIDIMIAFNPEGVISKVNVFRHSETPCHVIGMTKGKFLDQFNGITLVEKLRLLVGLKPVNRGDIQAMTSGTVTSRAVAEAVTEARKAFYKLYIDNQKTKK